MRTEIINALNKTKLAFSEDLLTEEERLKIASNYYSELYKCLQASVQGLTNIYPGGAWDITCCWMGMDNKNHIIIELSIYDKLASIFIYGSPPALFVEQIINCIYGKEFILLLPEEVEILQKTQDYYKIF